MIRLIGPLVALCALASCAEDGSSRSAASTLAAWAPSRIDATAIDTSTNPADDFYAFVNGRWLATTTIPSDVPWTSPYVDNYFEVRRRLGTIIEEAVPEGSEAAAEAQPIRDLYRSYMDVERIETLGLEPLARVLGAVDAVTETADLAAMFAELNRRHFRHTDDGSRHAVPFVIAARPDDRDASRMTAVLAPAGLGMSSRAAYIAEDARETRARYREHVERTLALAATPDAAAQASAVVALETALAEAALSPTERMEHERTYNKLERTELRRLMPAFDWERYLERAGLGAVEAFVVPDVDYLRGLDRLLSSTPMDTWRAYLRWQLLRVYSAYLPERFVEQEFAFFGRVELGNDTLRPREQRAIIVVEQAFPDLLGRLYVERFLEPGVKADVTAMAEAIRREFRASLESLDWMSAPTKRAAIDKLDKLDIKIAYPSQWPRLEVTIDAGDIIGNLMRISAARYERAVTSIGRPVDRDAWQVPAYASSAYYYRVMNELAIPAGYLLPPWYDINAEPALNYGGIGTVIAHEIGHAFDNQGSEYDGDGNLRDWWSESDRERFERRTERLVVQYGRYSPRPGQFVDGRLTLSENIGDLTGVTIAYRAFETETRSAERAVVDGFTPEQRFFISFASHWRAKYTDALLTRILASDGHAPQRYRANGPLRNFEPFYEAFEVSPGDGMFLPAGERVAIW